MATIQTLTKPEVEARVVQAPVPVALDFYQTTCPPCRALEPRLQGIIGRYAAGWTRQAAPDAQGNLRVHVDIRINISRVRRVRVRWRSQGGD